MPLRCHFFLVRKILLILSMRQYTWVYNGLQIVLRGDPMKDYRTGASSPTIEELERKRDDLKKRIEYLKRYDGAHLSAFSELDLLWQSLQKVEKELEQKRT